MFPNLSLGPSHILTYIGKFMVQPFGYEIHWYCCICARQQQLWIQSLSRKVPPWSDWCKPPEDEDEEVKLGKKLRGRNRGNEQVENADGEEEMSKRGRTGPILSIPGYIFHVIRSP